MAWNYCFLVHWLLYMTLILPFHYCWPALELTGGDPASGNNGTTDGLNTDANILNSNNTQRDASALVAQLKSLNTFANHIDNVKSPRVEALTLEKIETGEEFKPSIRLADREDNMIPLLPLHASQFNNIPISKSVSPVLVQYLPQTVYQNGIRYLHLVPTKPLMIPFNSFINAPAFPAQMSHEPPQLLFAHNNVHVGNIPLPTSPVNAVPSSYKLPPAPAMLRSSVLLNPTFGNGGSNTSPENRHSGNAPSATLITISAAPSEIPGNAYHLQSLPTHYNYRGSRDLKEHAHISAPIFSLNLNEYLPDAYKPLPIRVKGRLQ